MTKTMRITKAQRFEDIKALLNGSAPVYGSTVEDAIAVLNHELELLAKKNSSENKRQTAVQKENEAYKELILEFLGGLDADHPGMTCTDIGKDIPALNDFNNQKISALMRALKAEGRVTDQKVKNKTLFRLA